MRVLRNTRHTAANQATRKTITYGRYCLLQRHLFPGPEGGASLRMWLFGSLFCGRNGHYASRVYPPVLSAPCFMLYPPSDHQSLVERPLSLSWHAYERSARAALLVSDRVTEIRHLTGQLLFRPPTVRQPVSFTHSSWLEVLSPRLNLPTSACANRQRISN